MSKENNLITVTAADIDVTDKVRVLESNISRNITIAEFIDALNGTALLDARYSINDQPNALYTLVATDLNSLVLMENSNVNTATVPPDADVMFADGSKILVVQEGTGATTIAAGAGVTLHAAGGVLTTTAQYQVATLIKKAANEWLVQW